MNNNRPMRRSVPQASRAMPTANASCPLPQCSAPEAVLPVMAYVPAQAFGEVYSECQALHSGTLFPALDKPFYGKGCR